MSAVWWTEGWVKSAEEEAAKKKDELQQELGDFAAEYSWRMACLVRARSVIAAEVKRMKRGEEIRQIM